MAGIRIYGSRKLKAEIDQARDFELMAPVPLSIVCFRYVPANGRSLSDDALDPLNDRILEECERRGVFFLTGAKLKGRTALRGLLAHLRSLGEELTSVQDARP
jgi:glutamate/tyrosine decarboxylase-like PLP-dependent enzyme